MGLCKCRTVTPMFCCDHRKYVCESCVNTEHTLCSVKTYLSWLQDSEPVKGCSVCATPIDSAENTLRLACYDLIHKNCLLAILKQERSHDRLEALKSCKCPSCNFSILPSARNGLLAESLRDFLVQTEEFRDIVEALLPTRHIIKRPIDQQSHIILNSIQPNTSVHGNHIVEIGGSRSLTRSKSMNGMKSMSSWKNWYLQTSNTKSQGNIISGLKQVSLNCLRPSRAKSIMMLLLLTVSFATIILVKI